MKDVLKILGFLLLAEILTLFINVTLAFSGSWIFRLVTAVCTLAILAGLMAQAGHSIGKADRKLLKQKPDAVHPKKPVVLGLVSILPFQILWILLTLAKCGVLDGGFYRFYKLLCAPFLQVCNLVCDDVTAASLPVWGLVILAILSVIPYAAVIIAYRMTMKGKSVEEMMYQK